MMILGFIVVAKLLSFSSGYGHRQTAVYWTKCYSAPLCLNGGRCLGKSEQGCVCPRGFSGSRCQHDVNECNENNGGCEQSCCNLHGSYVCRCEHGFRLKSDGKSCEDVNECANYNGGCNQICKNMPGSYKCDCEPGYKLHADNRTCLPVSESSIRTRTKCEVKNGGCEHLCERSSTGAVKCKCKPGYVLTRDGKGCKSVNPCRFSNGGCQHFCHFDVAKSTRTCSCRPGFILQPDESTCEDDDECAASPCDQLCKNTPGSFACLCKQGYKLNLDGNTCVEIPSRIKIVTEVRATVGKFDSTNSSNADDYDVEVEPEKEPELDLQEGKPLPTKQPDLTEEEELIEKTVQTKFKTEISHEQKPKDTDEYEEIIDSSILLKKTESEFYDVINETSRKENEFESVAKKEETVFTTKVITLPTPPPELVVDHCEGDNGGCDHDCTSTPNGPLCSCRDGWRLADDGVGCIDIDECAENEGGCTQRCVNFIGSYECTCLFGYRLRADRKTCEKTDEDSWPVRGDNPEDFEENDRHRALKQERKAKKIQSSSRRHYDLHSNELEDSPVDTKLALAMKCIAGAFGPDCSYTCDSCKNNGKCNSRRNGCDCPPGFTGLTCEHGCTKGTYGDQCRKLCKCQHGYDCNPVDGHCTPSSQSIKKRKQNQRHVNLDGYLNDEPVGKEVEESARSLPCPMGKSGPGCVKECRCGIGGACDELGQCQCPLGKTGPACSEDCPKGRYGPDCSHRCDCDHEAVCDIRTGQCRCKPGFYGAKCQHRCPPGRFGHQCVQLCNCHTQGTSFCDVVSGKCHCKPGHTGPTCKQNFIR